ncbi:Microfibrillar-associated protein 1 [Haplosporangium bisporale]|nr:Microfibrillar-associated protein 1 [Haplosporangium bisporale]
MSSKRAGLPSLNSAPSSSKKPLQPVKVQRYRAGQAPEGYVDPALQSSDDEDQDEAQQHGIRAGRGGINMAIGAHPPEEPKMAYQILNVEKMTLERQMEKSRQHTSGRAVSEDIPVALDRRLQRLQAIEIGDRRSRGDTRSRRRHDNSDEDSEENSPASDEDMDDEEEASRRRMALRARGMREEEEEELLGHEDEDDDEVDEVDNDDSSRRTKARRAGEENEGEESSEYTSSGSEEESSDDDGPRRTLMKPVFVPKSQRITIDEMSRVEIAAELTEHARQEEIERRKKESHQMLKEYVARQAAVDDVPDIDNFADVDDTDGLDEEAEFDQWKLRELKRIKRDREELEAREAEKAEIERRRELTEEERVKEDMEYLAKKKAEEESERKSGGPVEKYHHKGAFFMDTDEAILRRSTNEATPDAIRDIKALPKVMQVRNFGRAGQTKYTTLKDQDTSQASGWTDPAMRHIQSRNRLAGFRGDDYKIAAKLTGEDRGGPGGLRNRGGQDNASYRGNRGGGEHSDRYSSSRSGHYQEDSRRRDFNDNGRYRDLDDRSSRRYDDRDRPASSSSSRHDHDRNRNRDGESSSKRRRY